MYSNRLKTLTKLIVAVAIVVTVLKGEGELVGEAKGVEAKYIGSGVGGSTFGMAIHPSDTKRIFFTGDMGLVYKTSNGGESWEIIEGLNNMRFIHYAPSDSNIMWTGGERGLHKSEDGGESWKSKYDYGTYFGALAIDSKDANVIYAAQGFVPRIKVGWSKGRVWKSVDGGESWEELKRPGGSLDEDSNKNRNYSKIVIDPNSNYVEGRGHSRVYLMGRDGLFKSEDYGESWEEISFFESGQGSDLVLVKEGSKSKLYATVIPVKGYPKKGVYESEDAGASWIRRNSGIESMLYKVEQRNSDINAQNMRSVMISGSQADSNRLYVGCYQGVARSDDGGKTWVQNTPGETSYVKHKSGVYLAIPGKSRLAHAKSFWGGIDNFMRIEASPSNPNMVMFTDNQDLHISMDGGESWQSESFDYTERFVATESVIPELAEDSPKNRYTHRIKSRGVQTNVNMDVAIDPFDDKVYYATYMDTGLQISRDKGESWEHPSDGIAPRGHAWAVEVDPNQEGAVWASVGEEGGVYYSQDKGVSWVSVSLPSSVGKISDIVVDSRDKERRILYVATDKRGVYRSRDDGASWEEVLSEPGVRLKFDPKDYDRLYVGSKGGLYKTDDQGASWKKLHEDKIGYVHNLSVGKSNNLYVVAREPESQKWGIRKLWKSFDGGESVTEFTPKFMTYMGAVAVHPNNPKYLYICNYTQKALDETQQMIVARSMDGGVTWKKVGGKLAFDEGHNIHIDPNNYQHLLINTNSSLIDVVDNYEEDRSYIRKLHDYILSVWNTLID
jgi:photosystem II stability/assembly factor-like uncharacterized protein